jgi:cysteine-rich repeat protein
MKGGRLAWLWTCLGLLAFAALPACGGGGDDDEDVDAGDVGDIEDMEEVPDGTDDGRDVREDVREDGAEAEVPVTCGDGIVDDDEECDDGNADNTDECLDTCLDASCGDGFVWDGEEDCDDGNTTSGDGCSALCNTELVTCGDGVVDDGEDCDDGNDDNTDACLDDCSAASCGDGFVWGGEEDCDGDATQPCDTSCGSTGRQDCGVDCAWGACTPPVEECNGVDDDCDGAIDNGLPCLPGDAVACTTTCGSTGSGVCTASCAIPAPADCTPPAEECNGVDDDCDGAADEDFGCVQGATVSCTTSCGTVNPAATCTMACAVPTVDECPYPPEECNGLDDDCSGEADNGFDCVMGATSGCLTTCGSTNPAGVCSATCTVPAPADCPIPAEACNGADDDCDTAIDDGFTCTAGASQPCTAGACTGSQLCDGATCTWGSCNFGTGPTNDTCAGSLPDISSGGVFTGNTCAAANDYTYSCGTTAAASPDVVFQLVLTENRDVVIDTAGSAFDAMLFIRHGGTAGCPGTTADRCDDNTAGSGQARIQWNNMPMGTYWVILDGAGAGARGAYVLNVAIASPPPPRNDTCATAINLGAVGTISGSTTSATDDHTPSCATGTGGQDVWFSFTLGGRELVYLDVQDGAMWNSVLEVRRGPCGATMTSAACNDNACGGTRSQWFGLLDAGTYYVVVDGTAATERGGFNLLYQHTGCTGGVQITGNGDYDGTTGGMGSDRAGTCGGNTSQENYLWMAVCSPRDVTATTCNATTNYDTVLYFLAGSCGGAGVELGCNNDSAACTVDTERSTLTSSLRQGLNFLYVDGYYGAEGDYRVTITGM